MGCVRWGLGSLEQWESVSGFSRAPNSPVTEELVSEAENRASKSWRARVCSCNIFFGHFLMHDPKWCPWEFRAAKLSSSVQPKGGTQRWSSDIQAIHRSGVPISSTYQILRIHFLAVQSYQINRQQAYRDFCVNQATSEVCEDLCSSSWWTTATSELWRWPLFWSEALCLFKRAEARFSLEKHHSGVWQSLGKQEAVSSGAVKLRNLRPFWGECRVKPREALTALWLAEESCPRGWRARGLTGEGARGGAVLGAEPSWGRSRPGGGAWSDRKVRPETEERRPCGDHKGGKTGGLQVWGGVAGGLRGGLGTYILVFRTHTSCRYSSGSVYMGKVYFYIPQTAYM